MKDYQDGTLILNLEIEFELQIRKIPVQISIKVIGQERIIK